MSKRVQLTKWWSADLTHLELVSVEEWEPDVSPDGERRWTVDVLIGGQARRFTCVDSELTNEGRQWLEGSA